MHQCALHLGEATVTRLGSARLRRVYEDRWFKRCAVALAADDEVLVKT